MPKVMGHVRPERGPGRAKVAIQRHASRSGAAKALRGGWDYQVLIQGDDDFNAVFDATGEPLSAILDAVYGDRFAKRLEATALILAQTLYVEVIAFTDATIRDLRDFRIMHEAPAILVLEATYDEGEVARALRAVGATEATG